MLSRLSLCGGNLYFPTLRSFSINVKQMARFDGSFRQTGFGIRTAKTTLRERLLGPTTGKPFIYGTYAIGGAAIFGVGMLCYYGLDVGSKTSARNEAFLWPNYVKERIQHTYAYLLGSLAITAGSGYTVSRSPALVSLMSRGTLPVFLGGMAAIIGTGILVQSINYESNRPLKIGAWILHSAVMGGVLAPLCFAGGALLLRAAWYTAGICSGLSATAICAPSDKFLNLAGPLSMGLGFIFVANIGSLFFSPQSALGAGLSSIVIYGGLILFSAFLLYDTQKIIHRAKMTPSPQTYYNEYGQPTQFVQNSFDPINAQISLYSDILNIFIRMVMILGMGSSQRRK